MNTLKEKFSEITICTEIEGCSKQSDNCVKIADDFAIGFAEWMSYLIHRNYKSGGYWFAKGEIKTTQQLLETYKKEKGL